MIEDGRPHNAVIGTRKTEQPNRGEIAPRVRCLQDSQVHFVEKQQGVLLSLFVAPRQREAEDEMKSTSGSERNPGKLLDGKR